MSVIDRLKQVVMMGLNRYNLNLNNQKTPSVTTPTQKYDMTEQGKKWRAEASAPISSYPSPGLVTYDFADRGYSKFIDSNEYKDKPQFKKAPKEVLTAILKNSLKHDFDPILAGAVSKHETDNYNTMREYAAKNRPGMGGFGPFQLTKYGMQPAGNMGGDPSYNQYSDEQLLEPDFNSDKGIEKLKANLLKAKAVKEWAPENNPKDPYRQIKGMYQFFNGSTDPERKAKIVKYYLER